MKSTMRCFAIFLITFAMIWSLGCGSSDDGPVQPAPYNGPAPGSQPGGREGVLPEEGP